MMAEFLFLDQYILRNIQALSLCLSGTILEVRSIDLLKSNKEPNRLEHHTDRYHSENLIIRRGQTFQMSIELSRPFNSKTDKLNLDLKLGQFCHLTTLSPNSSFKLYSPYSLETSFKSIKKILLTQNIWMVLYLHMNMTWKCKWRVRDLFLYLRVLATTHNPIPMRNIHTLWVADQEIVSPCHICVWVITDRAIQVMKDGIFIAIQIILLKPLARSTKKCSKIHLDDKKRITGEKCKQIDSKTYKTSWNWSRQT